MSYKTQIYLGDDFSEYDYDYILRIIFDTPYFDGKKCTTGLHKMYAQASLASYHHKCEYFKTFALIDVIPDDASLCQIVTEHCERINSIRWQRAKRLKKRLHEMLENSFVCFITLTFNDDYIDSLSYDTKRRYVKEWFSQFECPYTANVDYGEHNGRIHYHGVLCGTKKHIDAVEWKYGFKHVLEVGYSKDDENRVSKYVAKLSYHSLKDTTAQTKTIYFRNYNKYVTDNDWYIEKDHKEMVFYGKKADVKLLSTMGDKIGDYFALLNTYKCANDISDFKFYKVPLGE